MRFMRGSGFGSGEVVSDAGDAGARDQEGEEVQGGALEGGERAEAEDWGLSCLTNVRSTHGLELRRSYPPAPHPPDENNLKNAA